MVRPFERHHTLIGGLARPRIEGEHAPTAGSEGTQRGPGTELFDGPFPGGGRPQREVALALHHEQAHRPPALDLEHERAALELQGGREQRASRHQLAEGRLEDVGKGVPPEDFLPGAVEPDHLSPHPRPLENEALQSVAVLGGAHCFHGTAAAPVASPWPGTGPAPGAWDGRPGAGRRS